MPGFARTTAERPSAPTKEEQRRRAEAKALGERTLMRTITVFGNKTDEGASAHP